MAKRQQSTQDLVVRDGLQPAWYSSQPRLALRREGLAWRSSQPFRAEYPEPKEISLMQAADRFEPSIRGQPRSESVFDSSGLPEATT